MDLISEADRDAMRTRVAAATRGPWTWDGRQVSSLEGRAGDPDTYEYDTEVIEVTHLEGTCSKACELELEISEADQEFIAHARTDIELLLEENERLRALAAPLLQQRTEEEA